MILRIHCVVFLSLGNAHPHQKGPSLPFIMRFAGLVWLVVIPTSAMVACAEHSFQRLDVVEGWLIERRVDEHQKLSCRASMKTGGTWFAARIHLDASGQVVIPEGLLDPNLTSEQLSAVRAAVSRCQDSILYFP